ncbi:hypothetical protein [Natronorarus salvus]|uniref:hypothetical protein n=1 Tax=Natronorarus salvus TaxID=3117733 RepID=UPI002F266974
MGDDDLELDEDIGEATIVYEHPEEGTVEQEVPNEHIAYFQDHWLIKTGEDEDGRDLVRRIPAQRVHYVERTVERFEEEVKTLRDQVQSFAKDIRTKLPVGGARGGQGGADDGSVHRIDVEFDDDEDHPREP